MQSHRIGHARGRRSHSRDSGWAEKQRWIHLLQVCRFVLVVGIRALDWRRPASREGRDASQERTLILNRGPSCSERQSNERVFRGRITVVHPSGPDAPTDSVFRSLPRLPRYVTSWTRSRDIVAEENRDPTNLFKDLYSWQMSSLILNDHCANSLATLSLLSLSLWYH